VKVRELIAKLQEMPQDMEVQMAPIDFVYCDINSVGVDTYKTYKRGKEPTEHTVVSISDMEEK
jgi:hypothetical protein